jgi:putative FmdB family regulatory protein
MPLYEYKCDNCGEVFEVMQKFVDETLTTHQKCGGKVERLISTSAFQFKGSGWYVNDYAKKSSPSAGKDSPGNEASGKDAPASASTKTETSTKSDNSNGSSSTSTATPVATSSGSGSDTKSKS